MVQNRELLIELGIVALIAFGWFFVSTNINPQLGNIYSALTVGAIIAVIIDARYGKKDIKLINKNVSWIKAFMVAIGSYIVLILSIKIATPIAGAIPLTQILQSLASSAPVYSNSVFFNILIFGVLVAYIESFAIFQALLDLLSSMFGFKINKQNLFNPKLILVIVGISFFFLLLHITTRGISAESDLIVVFFMGFISLVTLVWYQEGRIPILFHILSNSIAAASIFGIVDIGTLTNSIILTLVGIV